MKAQQLPKGMNHDDIRAILSKYENQTGIEAVAELEAAIEAEQAFVNIKVPIAKIAAIRTLLAKPIGKGEGSEVRKVAEKRKQYPSEP